MSTRLRHKYISCKRKETMDDLRVQSFKYILLFLRVGIWVRWSNPWYPRTHLFKYVFSPYFCTFSTDSMSFKRWGFYTEAAYSRWERTRVLYISSSLSLHTLDENLLYSRPISFFHFAQMKCRYMDQDKSDEMRTSKYFKASTCSIGTA